MAYGVRVTAVVEYWCNLSEEDSQKIDDFIRESADPDDPDMLEEAVQELYGKGEIELYDDSVEADFYTDKIISVERLS